MKYNETMKNIMSKQLQKDYYRLRTQLIAKRCFENQLGYFWKEKFLFSFEKFRKKNLNLWLRNDNEKYENNMTIPIV